MSTSTHPADEVTPRWVAALLEEHGIAKPGTTVTLSPLGGGVSSHIVRAEAPDGRAWVVKMPRLRFRVDDDWEVERRRAAVEWRAGRLFADRLGPGHVVPLLAYDESEQTLVMEPAPPGHGAWKERLLAGDIQPATAQAAGKLLARIHGLVDRLKTDELREDDLFRQQRIAPYFDTAAEREPAAAAKLMAITFGFFGRSDLVHGDFSPKNILVGAKPDDIRLVDHEVVTRGDAAFDVAFLATHLVLKGTHRPRHTAKLRGALTAFRDAYRETRRNTVLAVDKNWEPRAAGYLGGLMLARAIGKSKAEYLAETNRVKARRAALRVLDEAPADLVEAFDIALPAKDD